MCRCHLAVSVDFNLHLPAALSMETQRAAVI